MRMHKNMLGGGHLLGTSGALLALLLGVMLFPTTPDSAHAETPATPAETSPRATTSVGLTVPATIEFADVMATPSGATTTASATIGVTTTASAGYKLYLYAEDNSLKSLNPNTTQSIASASASSLNNFTNNTWGYNLTEGTAAGTTYSALPTTNTTPTQTKDTSTTSSANDIYTLSLGAKVDSTIPSGTYTSTLTISVVAEPKEVTTITEMATMQEMTPEICTNSQEGDTVRIADERDGKMYWIAKLKDGNCWMTQNLDLDLSTEEALTPEDSDVSRSWTPANNTLTDGTQTTTDNTAVWSWNLGDYVLTTPNAGTSCGTSGKSDFGDCTSVGFQSVAGMTPMADGNTTDVISGNTYNAHYHVGNHYTWNAATAGTGGADVVGRDATDSICPKGWQLPTSNNSNSGSFQALMTAYSISSNTAGSTALVSAPLYFVRSGYVTSGSLGGAGYSGTYWSSTAVSSASSAYNLGFTSGYVLPSDTYSRFNGRSVRCLAR